MPLAPSYVKLVHLLLNAPLASKKITEPFLQDNVSAELASIKLSSKMVPLFVNLAALFVHLVLFFLITALTVMLTPTEFWDMMLKETKSATVNPATLPTPTINVFNLTVLLILTVQLASLSLALQVA